MSLVSCDVSFHFRTKFLILRFTLDHRFPLPPIPNPVVLAVLLKAETVGDGGAAAPGRRIVARILVGHVGEFFGEGRSGPCYFADSVHFALAPAALVGAPVGPEERAKAVF